MNTMTTLQSEMNNMLTAMKTLADVMITTGEKTAALHFDSGKVYRELAYKQLKKMSAVRNLEQAGDFLWGQIEPMGAFNKQLLDDWKKLVALNTELSNGIKTAFASEEKSSTVDSVFSQSAPAAAKTVTKISSKRSTKPARKTTAS